MQLLTIRPSDSVQTADDQTLQIRLLLICQAEGIHSRYTELSPEEGGLTALGWEQTNQLGDWLAAHEKIDLLISAPQLRSRLTAQRIGQMVNRSVLLNKDLPHHRRAPTTVSGIHTDRSRFYAPLHIHQQFEQEEQHRLFGQRLTAALQQIVHEHWGKTIVLVMDGNAVATALALFCGQQGASFSIGHTSISEVFWHGGAWCVAYVNRFEHNPAPHLPNVSSANNTPIVAETASEDEELAHITHTYDGLLATDIDLTDQARDARIRHFLKFANIVTNMRVLDVGAGMGRLSLMVAEDGASEVVAVDISPAMLEMAEYFRLSSATPTSARVSFRLAAAQRMPFRSEGFDVAICRLVLHLTQKPERILQEVVRLLKPGGILVMADLLGADDAVKRATQNTIEARRNPCHVAARSADQYRKLITTANLTIEAESTAVFERDLEDWLNDLNTDPTSRAIVREMMEASMETNAAGLYVRRQAGKLVFDQRLIYIKASKRA